MNDQAHTQPSVDASREEGNNTTGTRLSAEYTKTDNITVFEAATNSKRQHEHLSDADDNVKNVEQLSKKSRRFTTMQFLLGRSERNKNSVGQTSLPATTSPVIERSTARDSENVERDTSLFESDISLQAQTLYRPGDFTVYNVRKLLSDLYDLMRGKRYLRISGIKFYVKHVLYRGRFSRVELVEESSTGELWCMKRTWIAREVDLEEAAHEYNVLMSHAHPLIVYAVHAGLVIAPNKKLRTHAEVRMIMPYVEGVCLEEELYKRRHQDDPMPVQRVLRIMRQLLDALLELHRYRVPLVHLDLCPGNVIMTRYEDWPVIVGLDSAGPAHVDLRDKAEIRRLKFLSEEIVDPWYRAPELVDINANSFFDERADIWSAGCLMYALMYYESPFRPKMRQNLFGGAGVMHLERETWLDVKNRQKRGAFNVPFDIYPAEVLQLMRRMIVPNPRQRVTTEIAIQLIDSLIVQLGSDTQIDVKYPWMHPMVAGVIGGDDYDGMMVGEKSLSASTGEGAQSTHSTTLLQNQRRLSGSSVSSMHAGGSPYASTNMATKLLQRLNKPTQQTSASSGGAAGLKDDFLGRSLAQTLAFNEVVLNHLCNPPSAPHEKLRLGVTTPSGSIASYQSAEKPAASVDRTTITNITGSFIASQLNEPAFPAGSRRSDQQRQNLTTNNAQLLGGTMLPDQTTTTSTIR